MLIRMMILCVHSKYAFQNLSIISGILNSFSLKTWFVFRVRIRDLDANSISFDWISWSYFGCFKLVLTRRDWINNYDTCNSVRYIQEYTQSQKSLAQISKRKQVRNIFLRFWNRFFFNCYWGRSGPAALGRLPRGMVMLLFLVLLVRIPPPHGW